MAWPFVELGKLISHRKEFIEISPDVTYARCRVQTSARGIVLRDRVAGSEIKTKKQQVCRTGEFLVAEIDAKMGGYGIVPPDLDGAIVSSHYFLFEVDERRLMRSFLEWYSRTPAFLEQIAARGSTNYASVRPANVLGYQVPLPSLDEQRRVVEKLDRVAALVDERRNAIEAAERETQALLLKAFQRAIDGAPLRPMAEVAPLVRRPVEIDSDAAYPELGVRSFGRGTFHKPELPGVEVGNKKLFRICSGDLVFNIVFAWEGAVAVAQPEDDGRVGSHRFLTCVPAPDTATVEFLRFYFSTSEGLQKLGEASPGGAGRNRTLGLKKLESLRVPVPPIGRQHWFDRLQAKAHEARTIRANTAQDVEALIPAMLHEIFDGGAKAA
ncbi:restriction endonuclease subunit S domain-containing protein [Alterinioella nitratireducens]|uniref:restriction endonuclease subunit S n=1 Tax=Alterinioella nitratireducens TaxID=2735915 RepID=UPI0015532983|nr:restriction endonuclease subunit S [Alterinioella nitratireducens]